MTPIEVLPQVPCFPGDSGPWCPEASSSASAAVGNGRELPDPLVPRAMEGGLWPFKGVQPLPCISVTLPLDLGSGNLQRRGETAEGASSLLLPVAVLFPAKPLSLASKRELKAPGTCSSVVKRGDGQHLLPVASQPQVSLPSSQGDRTLMAAHC